MQKTVKSQFARLRILAAGGPIIRFHNKVFANLGLPAGLISRNGWAGGRQLTSIKDCHQDMG